ncbi:MAG: serine/threonine protein kinase [Deltaproteobacteria bacterium]|nr:serine/threonine protein kinase [Deltaproteobacteria bacterium]
MTLDPTASEWLCPVCDRAYDAPGACDDDGATLLEIAAEAAEPAPTTLAGRFTVHERLSEGGMGAVYRATQTSMGRPVALKIMHGRLSQDAAAARRFIREARLASHIAHPNVVSVIDFGQDPDGTLFLAMELLAGPTLAELLAREGPFDAARTVRIGVQIADALDAAHKRGIIHRDLKPGNVIVVDPTPGRDALKVVDFGLAKATDGDHTTLTGPGQIFGTPAYMSPEMAAGYEVGAPADLYALGVILFELLDKRLPFDGDSVQSILLAHVSRPPPPLPDHVPAALAAVIKRLLAKEPAARYASAAARARRPRPRARLRAVRARGPGDAAPPPVAASAPAETPGRAWLAVTRPAPTGQEHETVRPPGPRRAGGCWSRSRGSRPWRSWSGSRRATPRARRRARRSQRPSWRPARGSRRSRRRRRRPRRRPRRRSTRRARRSSRSTPRARRARRGTTSSRRRPAKTQRRPWCS